MEGATDAEISFSVGAAVDNTDYWACTLYYFTFGTIIGSLIIIIGLLGNGLTIRIMGAESADRHKSSTIYSLFHLAIADNIVLITYFFAIPPIGFKKVIWGNDFRIGDNYDLVNVLYVIEISQIFNQISAFITMIVTWQRYISVCSPHRAKQLCTSRSVNILTVAAYSISITFYLPCFFFYFIEVKPGGYYLPTSTSLVTNQPFQIIHGAILGSLLNYFIPAISLSYMSLKIIRTMREQSKLTQKSNSRQNRNHRMMKELTISSIGLVVLFVVCRSLDPIRRVLVWLYDPYQYATHCGAVLQFWAFFPRVASMVNSAANFIIYIVFAKGFRDKVLALIWRKKTAVGPFLVTKMDPPRKHISTIASM